jgi:ABC-type lipoprotein export system ATPase subunit
VDATNNAGALLRLSGVHKRYRSGDSVVHALYGIDLQVERGEMLAICGPSGHGKTCLLSLAGLVDQPTDGSIEFAGTATQAMGEPERATLRNAHIGQVFQHYSLIPGLTAQENVALPLLLRRHRLTRSAVAGACEQANELLARLGLAAQQRLYAKQLDASQCQRVTIARALIGRPLLVVADEPTSRLDSGSVRMVMELFAACQREHGMAFLIATRDQRQLVKAGRTLQLSEGRILGVPADTPRPMRAWA